METSKIEEFLRKNKENQRNVGVAGRHGISGVLAWSRAACGVSAWSGRAGLEMGVVLPWALSTGPQREGHQPWGGFAHMVRLRHLRSVLLTAGRN